jgi:hypothetical protein
MPTRKTIRTIAALIPYLGQVIKYSIDDGDTWKYARLQLPGQPARQFGKEGLGYQAWAEIEEDGITRVVELTVKKFRDGLIAQPVTKAEVNGKEWPHEVEGD